MTTTRDRQANEVIRQQGGDVLLLEHAQDEDETTIATCPSYDYRGQYWRVGSDHAHYQLDGDPLLFCGADLATCSCIHA